MWFTTFIIANLWGRRTRSGLTLLGVAIAVAVIVAMFGVVKDFENSLTAMYLENGYDLVVMDSGSMGIDDGALDESFAAKIRTVAGVQETHPVLLLYSSAKDPQTPGRQTMVSMQGIRCDSPDARNLEITSGRMFVDGEKREIVIGERLGETLGKKPGDSLLLIEDQKFDIVGVFRSKNMIIANSILIPLDAMKIANGAEEVTQFLVILDPKGRAEMPRVQNEIRAIDDQLKVYPVREIVDQSQEIRGVRAFSWVTSSIALLIGSIGMLNTLMMSVFERTREIATLRAIGWRRWRIALLILGESTLLCALGAGLGILGAVLLVRGLMLFPDVGYLISGRISLEVILKGFALAISLGLLGGLYPAWLAARMAPVEGLRHD